MKHLKLIGLLLLAASFANAQEHLEFKGRLKDSAGQPLTGNFLIHFRLAKATRRSRGVWTESRYVKVLAGNFTALLGDKTPIPKSLRTKDYRLTAKVPPGTGWSLEWASSPRWADRSAPPSAAEENVSKLRKEVNEYKRRIEALENAVKKHVPLVTQANIYIVKRNDTLKSIAQKLFGSPVHWIDIYRANNDRIRRGGELKSGQRLLIPKIVR